MTHKVIFVLFFIFIIENTLFSSNFYFARLKYSGGGDWYNDPEVLPNLALEIKKRVGIFIKPEEKIVSLENDEIFDYPFVYMTGHGNINLSSDELEKLRKYLENGGFLYVDDDYGLDKYFKKLIGMLYPDKSLVLLPSTHPIYHIFYDLDGLPKIHKHDGKPPQGYALFIGDHMAVFYTYESNISDGWTNKHNDPLSTRELAFRMGVNIFLYALLRNP